MIDHVSFHIKDIGKSKAFYFAALAPLSYKQLMEFPEWKVVGMGLDKPDFWFSEKETGGTGHIAFVAKTRAEVDAFYDAAIKAGGKDNGKPGVREDYSPNYYAAFVYDPDGNNIEVVCHAES